METYRPVLKYALVPVEGDGFVPQVVAAMLDDGSGTVARTLAAGEPVPYGALPVLVASTTAYASVLIESMARGWSPQLPRPWLVWVADAPMPPSPAAQYRVRALRNRIAGLSRLGYLPVLRTAETPQEAMTAKPVQAAADKLRRSIGKG